MDNNYRNNNNQPPHRPPNSNGRPRGPYQPYGRGRGGRGYYGRGGGNNRGGRGNYADRRANNPGLRVHGNGRYPPRNNNPQQSESSSPPPKQDDGRLNNSNSNQPPEGRNPFLEEGDNRASETTQSDQNKKISWTDEKRRARNRKSNERRRKKRQEEKENSRKEKAEAGKGRQEEAELSAALASSAAKIKGGQKPKGIIKDTTISTKVIEENIREELKNGRPNFSWEGLIAATGGADSLGFLMGVTRSALENSGIPLESIKEETILEFLAGCKTSTMINIIRDATTAEQYAKELTGSEIKKVTLESPPLDSIGLLDSRRQERAKKGEIDGDIAIRAIEKWSERYLPQQSKQIVAILESQEMDDSRAVNLATTPGAFATFLQENGVLPILIKHTPRRITDLPFINDDFDLGLSDDEDSKKEEAEGSEGKKDPIVYTLIIKNLRANPDNTLSLRPVPGNDWPPKPIISSLKNVIFRASYSDRQGGKHTSVFVDVNVEQEGGKYKLLLVSTEFEGVSDAYDILQESIYSMAKPAEGENIEMELWELKPDGTSMRLDEEATEEEIKGVIGGTTNDEPLGEEGTVEVNDGDEVVEITNGVETGRTSVNNTSSPKPMKVTHTPINNSKFTSLTPMETLKLHLDPRWKKGDEPRKTVILSLFPSYLATFLETDQCAIALGKLSNLSSAQLQQTIQPERFATFLAGINCTPKKFLYGPQLAGQSGSNIEYRMQIRITCDSEEGFKWSSKEMEENGITNPFKTGGEVVSGYAKDQQELYRASGHSYYIINESPNGKFEEDKVLGRGIGDTGWPPEVCEDFVSQVVPAKDNRGIKSLVITVVSSHKGVAGNRDNPPLSNDLASDKRRERERRGEKEHQIRNSRREYGHKPVVVLEGSFKDDDPSRVKMELIRRTKTIGAPLDLGDFKVAQAEVTSEASKQKIWSLCAIAHPSKEEKVQSSLVQIGLNNEDHDTVLTKGYSPYSTAQNTGEEKEQLKERISSHRRDEDSTCFVEFTSMHPEADPFGIIPSRSLCSDETMNTITFESAAQLITRGPYMNSDGQLVVSPVLKVTRAQNSRWRLYAKKVDKEKLLEYARALEKTAIAEYVKSMNHDKVPKLVEAGTTIISKQEIPIQSAASSQSGQSLPRVTPVKKDKPPIGQVKNTHISPTVPQSIGEEPERTEGNVASESVRKMRAELPDMSDKHWESHDSGSPSPAIKDSELLVKLTSLEEEAAVLRAQLNSQNEDLKAKSDSISIKEEENRKLKEEVIHVRKELEEEVNQVRKELKEELDQVRKELENSTTKSKELSIALEESHKAKSKGTTTTAPISEIKGAAEIVESIASTITKESVATQKLLRQCVQQVIEDHLIRSDRLTSQMSLDQLTYLAEHKKQLEDQIARADRAEARIDTTEQLLASMLSFTAANTASNSRRADLASVHSVYERSRAADGDECSPFTSTLEAAVKEIVQDVVENDTEYVDRSQFLNESNDEEDDSDQDESKSSERHSYEQENSNETDEGTESKTKEGDKEIEQEADKNKRQMDQADEDTKVKTDQTIEEKLEATEAEWDAIQRTKNSKTFDRMRNLGCTVKEAGEAMLCMSGESFKACGAIHAPHFLLSNFDLIVIQEVMLESDFANTVIELDFTPLHPEAQVYRRKEYLERFVVNKEMKEAIERYTKEGYMSVVCVVLSEDGRGAVRTAVRVGWLEGHSMDSANKFVTGPIAEELAMLATTCVEGRKILYTPRLTTWMETNFGFERLEAPPTPKRAVRVENGSVIVPAPIKLSKEVEEWKRVGDKQEEEDLRQAIEASKAENSSEEDATKRVGDKQEEEELRQAIEASKTENSSVEEATIVGSVGGDFSDTSPPQTGSRQPYSPLGNVQHQGPDSDEDETPPEKKAAPSQEQPVKKAEELDTSSDSESIGSSSGAGEVKQCSYCKLTNLHTYVCTVSGCENESCWECMGESDLAVPIKCSFHKRREEIGKNNSDDDDDDDSEDEDDDDNNDNSNNVREEERESKDVEGNNGGGSDSQSSDNNNNNSDDPQDEDHPPPRLSMPFSIGTGQRQEHDRPRRRIIKRRQLDYKKLGGSN